VNALALTATGLALVLAVVLSCAVGAIGIPLSTTVRAIALGVTGGARELEGALNIVWNLRLPRVLLAALIGASLGGSGAAMQGLFRNPLADPYLLGIASGASFGATLALTLSGRLPAAYVDGTLDPNVASSFVPLAASVGAAGALLATLALSRAGSRRAEATAILLSGTVVGSVLISLSTVLMLRDADRVRAVFAWTLGNLAGASWSNLGRALPYVVVGLLVLQSLARGLDALQLGEETARTLGVQPARVRLGVILGASVATAACVSFAGVVGFVGLIAPHIMRRLGSPRHRLLLPASSLAGALLLVLADLGARLLVRPAELPVGIVTGLLGGPFFLWLLRQRA
jgi:iron complex transport system permease protein